MKKIIKTFLVMIGTLLLMYEGYNIYVDIHSFKEFERARVVLDEIPEGTDKYTFRTLERFNDVYDIDITPIKNCYVVSISNGEYPYIFAFRLESLLYKFKYQNWYFVYPEYDWPFRSWCDGGAQFGIKKDNKNIGCYDKNRQLFEDTISNPCGTIKW